MSHYLLGNTNQDTRYDIVRIKLLLLMEAVDK